MIILVGESGSGKDTLMNKVVELTALNPVISYTTRPMRVGEVEGIAYHFITKEEFSRKDSEGFFIEKSGYRGWLYGMAKKDCNDKKIVVVDPCGLRSLKRAGVNTFSFYIKVDERERLIRLANRGDDVTELCRRIISDRDTFRGIEDEVDGTIENYDINVSAFNIITRLERWMVL